MKMQMIVKINPLGKRIFFEPAPQILTATPKLPSTNNLIPWVLKAMEELESTEGEWVDYYDFFPIIAEHWGHSPVAISGAYSLRSQGHYALERLTQQGRILRCRGIRGVYSLEPSGRELAANYYFPEITERYPDFPEPEKPANLSIPYLEEHYDKMLPQMQKMCTKYRVDADEQIAEHMHYMITRDSIRRSIDSSGHPPPSHVVAFAWLRNSILRHFAAKKRCPIAISRGGSNWEYEAYEERRANGEPVSKQWYGKTYMDIHKVIQVGEEGEESIIEIVEMSPKSTSEEEDIPECLL